MGLFDWFKASVACPSCGVRCDDALLGQTKLHPAARQNELTVGSPLPLTAGDADDARYTVLSPAPSGEGRILQLWECPACRAPGQWFEVVVRGGRIASIEAVRLTQDRLAAANYIEDESLLASSPGQSDPRQALTRLRSSLVSDIEK